MTPYESLDAHQDGRAPLRLYPWLIAERDVREAQERFAGAMALGYVCWPRIYRDAVAHVLRHRITRCWSPARKAHR